MSKLSIKTQSKSGNHDPKLKTDIGYVTVFIDSDRDYVIADAFMGQGKNYQRREVSLLSLYKDGREVFTGSFTELCNLLSPL